MDGVAPRLPRNTNLSARLCEITSALKKVPSLRDEEFYFYFVFYKYVVPNGTTLTWDMLMGRLIVVSHDTAHVMCRIA
jgi:hypothetical protein